MELNLTTFVLEIVNFLILVWILKRFLYRPVLDIIAKRRAAIEQEKTDAEQQLSQARTLENQYRDRLSAWEKEKSAARETLQQELESERKHQLEKLQKELADQQEKARSAVEKQCEEQNRKAEHQAMDQAAVFASRLLDTGASPELEARLVQRLLDDVATLDEEQKQNIFATKNGHVSTVEIASAFPLSSEQQQHLQQGLDAAAGQPLEIRYRICPELKAGVLITTSAWALRANLRDELASFSEFAYASR